MHKPYMKHFKALIKNNQGHKNMLNSIVCQPISSQKHYNNLCQREEDIEKQPPCIKLFPQKIGHNRNIVCLEWIFKKLEAVWKKLQRPAAFNSSSNFEPLLFEQHSFWLPKYLKTFLFSSRGLLSPPFMRHILHILASAHSFLAC